MQPDLPVLNFPAYEWTFRFQEGQWWILDVFRQKYVVLTPEEWVRQHAGRFLTDNGYPKSVIAVEKQLDLNGLKRRFDLVAFDRNNRPFLLVECKRPEVEITAGVMNQAAQYNYTLQAPYLWVTNGVKHYILKFHPGGQPEIMEKLPAFGNIE